MRNQYLKIKSRDNSNSRHISSLMKQDDFMLAFAALFQFVVLMLQLLLINLFHLEGTTEQEILGFISKGVASLPLLYVLPILLRKNASLCFLTYLIGGLLFLTSFLFHRETFHALLSLFFNVFAICLPCFICIAVIQNFDYFIKAMQYTSFCIFIFGCFYIGFVLLGYISASQYSMSFSYYLLIPACYFLYGFISSKKKVALIISLVSVLAMLLLGSRGAVVTYVIFAVYTICFQTKWNLKTVFSFLTLITILILFFVYFDAFIGWFYSFLSGMGLKSRSLILLQEGTFISHDSGRSQTYTKVLTAISEKPLMGYGIGGDRFLFDSYVHNFFLEILLDYGIVFGFVILIGLIVYMCKAYKRAGDKFFFIMWACIALIPLMVSGSYLTGSNFWIFMGLCVLFNKSFKGLRKTGSKYEKKSINHI